MFNKFETGPNFDRARQLISTPFAYQDVPLDVASTMTMLNVSGDFLYVDAASTGNITIELNNEQNAASAPFFAQPGFGINAVFKQLKLSWTAQPGKFVRLMYSSGDRIVPTNSTTVNGTVSVSQNGNLYQSAYKDTTPMPASSYLTVFSPGVNVNGAIIWAGTFSGCSTTGACLVSCLAKNGPPANVIDGDVIFQNDSPMAFSGGSNFYHAGRLVSPIKVPAGKGLYFANNACAENYVLRSVLYTLL